MCYIYMDGKVLKPQISTPNVCFILMHTFFSSQNISV